MSTPLETPLKTIALVGNPNCGKTTVFNCLTGSRQKVGNYPGVTVERKTGVITAPGRSQILAIDLPGTYSLSVRSPDERVVRDVLLGRLKDAPLPDAVVCVVDASNLRRNLYLVSQVIDLGLPVILALNMTDEAEALGLKINVELLSKSLGVPVVPMVASRRQGIQELIEAIYEGGKAPGKRPWNIPPLLLEYAQEIAQWLVEQKQFEPSVALGEALLLISREQLDQDDIICGDEAMIKRVGQMQEDCLKNDINWRSAVIEGRYSWVGTITERCIRRTKSMQVTISQRLDGVFTHPILGWFSFLFFMGLMFYTVFALAVVPMDLISSGFDWLNNWVVATLPPGELRDLLTNGVIAGVGGVAVFLPQILILFFYIGLLQDTGYMARAAFIMDRIMRTVGLHGKSFIPLLSSFACAVPGVMSTRIIENRKDRLVTILVAPLMSCSARLPVYTTMIAVLIPTPSLIHKVLLMLAMYVLGILGAFVMAWIFKCTLLKSETPSFIMELPPYRLPSVKTVILHMWERTAVFLKQAGTVILAVSILLWALMYYPHNEGLSGPEALEHSYAGQLGKFIEPVIEPLGFDWRIGVGLIGSLAAREVFVSTMSIIFNMEGAVEGSLQDSFRKATWPDGRPLFTPVVCIALMVYYVFAMQCLSTTVTVRRETNGWTWPLFQIVYMSLLAYLMTLLVYQIGRIITS